MESRSEKSKPCGSCGQQKPLAGGFHCDRRSRDGLSSTCKACAIRRTAEWVAGNQTRARETNRAIYLRKADEYKRRAKNWATTNRERRRQIVNAWDDKNRDRKNALERARRKCQYHANLEQSRVISRARSKKFRTQNPEKSQAWNRRSKARRAAAPMIGHVCYEAIRHRDRMVCHICRSKVEDKDLHFDHVIPLSKGGEHSQTNLAVSHSWCNLQKKAKILTLF